MLEIFFVPNSGVGNPLWKILDPPLPCMTLYVSVASKILNPIQPIRSDLKIRLNCKCLLLKC